MRRLISSIAFVCLTMGGLGSVAYGQNQDNPYAGGSRLGSRAAQVTQTRSASKVIQQFGQCIYKRRTGSVENFLALSMDAPDFDKQQRYLFDNVGDSCLEGYEATVRFSDNVLRGSLFEAAYRSKFAGSAPANFGPEIRTGFTETYSQPYSSAARRHIALEGLGECVVRADPAGARALVLSTPETASEAKAITVVKGSLSGCLASGQKAELSQPSLRAMLAEALYRLSMAAIAAPKSSN
jgi:hypothetical protein